MSRSCESQVAGSRKKVTNNLINKLYSGLIQAFTLSGLYISKNHLTGSEFFVCEPPLETYTYLV